MIPVQKNPAADLKNLRLQTSHYTTIKNSIQNFFLLQFHYLLTILTLQIILLFYFRFIFITSQCKQTNTLDMGYFFLSKRTALSWTGSYSIDVKLVELWDYM